MKIRAKANGDVIDLSDDTARELIEAGIYEPVDAETSTPSTTVEPLTTEHMPVRTKKAK